MQHPMSTFVNRPLCLKQICKFLPVSEFVGKGGEAADDVCNDQCGGAEKGPASVVEVEVEVKEDGEQGEEDDE